MRWGLFNALGGVETPMVGFIGRLQGKELGVELPPEQRAVTVPSLP